METILQQIKEIFASYGFWGTVVVLAVVLLTQLIKSPIVKAAEDWASKSGYDKAVVTRFLPVIPYALAFIGALVLSLAEKAWKVETLDWANVVAQAGIFGSCAVALFEIVKKQIQAYQSKNSTKQK